ncbi:MAG: BRO family protein [Oscillospiraceae bacterium]|nr:BRO family protein [Oscillospiraceae bacterium]
MENKNVIFQHEAFGQIRILVTEDGRTLFCASDIAAALDIPNGPSAVHSLCSNMEKQYGQTSAGMRLMNFIPMDDIIALIPCADADRVYAFAEWLETVVFPELEQDEDSGEADGDNSGFPDDGMYLIKLSDYLLHIDEKTRLYGYVKRLTQLAAELPPCDENFTLKAFAELFSDYADRMHESGTLPARYLKDGNADEIISLLDRELTAPAEMGYAFCEGCTTTDPICCGDRCCDCADDEDFEYEFSDEDDDEDSECEPAPVQKLVEGMTEAELAAMFSTVVEVLESIEDDLHCLYGYLTRGM